MMMMMMMMMMMIMTMIMMMIFCWIPQSNPGMPQHLVDRAVNNLPRRFGGNSPNDVFLMVKAFISDTELCQDVLVVWPGSEANATLGALQRIASNQVPGAGLSKVNQQVKRRLRGLNMEKNSMFSLFRCCSLPGRWAERSVAGSGLILGGELWSLWQGNLVYSSAGWPFCIAPVTTTQDWVPADESCQATTWRSCTSKCWGSHFAHYECAVSSVSLIDRLVLKKLESNLGFNGGRKSGFNILDFNVTTSKKGSPLATQVLVFKPSSELLLRLPWSQRLQREKMTIISSCLQSSQT